MKRLAVIALALVLIIAAGCGGGQQQAKEPVKIGFFAPVTGPAAADGASVTQAAKLAVKKINAGGGINGRQVELVEYDDSFDPKQAVSIAQKLTTKDKVAAVVSGSYSGPTRAAAPIYQNAKVPMISAYAIHPDITKAGDYIFRQSFIGPVQGKAGGYVAVELLKAKTVAILKVDNDFGTTLTKAFVEYVEAKGVKVLANESFAMGEKEFTPVLTKLKQLKPDLIYIPAYAGEGSQIVRQARELKLEAQFLGTEGIDSTMQFLKVAGAAAEGVIITTNLNRDSARPAVKDFLKDYAAQAGHAPDMVAASTYDAFMVLAEVMKKHGTAPDKIKEGMRQVKDFEAVTGVIKGYNKGGEVAKSVQIQKVAKGNFTFFAEITDPAIITPPEN